MIAGAPLWVGPLFLLAVGVAIVIWKWQDIHRRVGIWGRVGTVLGWFFLTLGLLGGLLPFLPGFPLGLLGLALLGPEDPVIRRVWRLVHRAAILLATAPPGYRRRLGRRVLRLEQRLLRRLHKRGYHDPWQRLP